MIKALFLIDINFSKITYQSGHSTVNKMTLNIKNNVLNVIWCPGHMGIQEIEIADELAKSAAKQSVSFPN